MSEVLLGVGLRDVPRDQYRLCTKPAATISATSISAPNASARASMSSAPARAPITSTSSCVTTSSSFEMQQIIDETIPALRRAQQHGKVRSSVSAVIRRRFSRSSATGRTWTVCSVTTNTRSRTNVFADETMPYLKSKGVGIMNAGPSARAADQRAAPVWLKEPDNVKRPRAKRPNIARKGVDIAKLALQFSSPSGHHDHDCRQRESG